ncbi:unnamed protein product [Penicillium olsonii]|nr:unnamed protein product [Penicillium olsonii]CAG7931256.1 unnamed protein product [Penicillium olsonii]
MSSPAAKRLRTNTIGDAQATQAETPSATSSQAAAKKAKDLVKRLDKNEIRRLLVDAAKAHPDVLLGVENSIKAAIEREKARVIDFDHLSKDVWRAMYRYTPMRDHYDDEKSYAVSDKVSSTISSIVRRCDPNTSFGTRYNGLSVLRKIAKTIASAHPQGDMVAFDVRTMFESDTVLVAGMINILNSMEDSELDSIFKGELYPKLVELRDLAGGCIFDGLDDVLAKIHGGDGEKQGEKQGE